MDANKITFKINTNEPLSVKDFSDSLMAFNNEYKIFTEGRAELLISEVRKGSYEVDFFTVVLPSLFASVEVMNTVFDYANHIKDLVILLSSGNVDESDDSQLSKQTVNNVGDILNPVINNYGTINIITNNEMVSITNEDAKTAIKNKPKILKRLASSIPSIAQQSLYKKQLFYWHQTGFDKNKPNIGNKGRIVSIQFDAVSVIFEDDSSTAKIEMTTSQDGVDWQERGYIVDVEVLRKGDKIVKYKIIHNYMSESVVEEPDLFNVKEE